MSAALQAGGAFKLRSVKQVSDALAVAVVEVGPVTISSVWISDIAGKPKVAWPRSARGYPIVSVSDDELRDEIEGEIADVVLGWRHA